MNDESNEEKNGEHLIYEHKNLKTVSIIFLSGHLIKKNSKNLREILKELQEQSGLKFVLIDYSKLKEIGKQIDRELVQFQINLREKGISIRHCGLSVAYRRGFIKVGTMKEKEVRGTLAEAVKEIATLNSK